MKLAALADIHISTEETVDYTNMIKRAVSGADVLVLSGDLTQEGRVEEAIVLRRILTDVDIPIVAIMGNHEYENGMENDIANTLRLPNLHLLRGSQVVIGGVGFAGVKGFIGGFGNRMLPKFGEPLLKQIVEAGANEALMLEKALSLLDTKVKIVLTHYSPIKATLQGEPEEIYPFLGLARLEEVINRNEVTMAFHGHAHRGTYEGKTSTGTPVYNVSLSVLQRMGLTASVHEITP